MTDIAFDFIVTGTVNDADRARVAEALTLGADVEPTEEVIAGVIDAELSARYPWLTWDVQPTWKNPTGLR